MKGRWHSIISVLVALTVVLGLFLTVTVPAFAVVTFGVGQGVAVTPTSVNSAARYTVTFTTAAGLIANVDNITVTFPTGTTVPASIPNNTVIVNGNVVDNATTPAPVVVGRAVTITVPAAVAIGATTVIFTQGAGVLNPSRGTTAARVTVATSAEPVAVTSPAYVIFPTLTLSPTSGARGASVSVAGAGYGTSLGVDIRNLGTPPGVAPGLLLGSGTSDASGNISLTVTIPNTAAAGANALQATDGAGTVSPLVNFTVTPSLTLTPATGMPGTTVQLTGSPWPAAAVVTAARVGGVSVLGSLSSTARAIGAGATAGTTHTPVAPSATILTDAELVAPVVDFVAAGVVAGDLVVNVTDNSADVVAVGGVTATTLTVTALTGNTDTITPNVFSTGDVYRVLVAPLTTATGAINSVAGGQLANVTIQVPLNATPGPKTVSVTIGATTATATFEVQARPATVTPDNGNVGTLVTLTGSGLTGGGAIPANSITFGGVLATHGAITIATDGSWIATNVPAPPTTPVGSGQVIVTDNGGRSAMGNFTVAPRVITIAPTTGVVGSQIVVSGTGYRRNGAVSVQQPAGLANQRATTTADAAGNFAVAITVNWPAPAAGNQTLVFTAVDTVTAGITDTENFAIPGAAINVSPSSQQVGGSVTVAGTGFAPFTALTGITVGGPIGVGTNVTPPAGVVTDALGNFSASVLVPGTIAVGGTTVQVTQGALVEIAIFTVTTAPASAATQLAPLGTNLVRVWTLDAATQTWKLFDPAVPAELNTLPNLVTGQGYFVKITTAQTVFLGTQQRNLSPGWNIIGW